MNYEIQDIGRLVMIRWDAEIISLTIEQAELLGSKLKAAIGSHDEIVQTRIPKPGVTLKMTHNEALWFLARLEKAVKEAIEFRREGVRLEWEREEALA